MKNIVTIFLLSLLFPTAVLAVKMNNLYQVDLPVTSQADDERVEAVKKGFIQVLVKLTGDVNVAKNSDIKSAIRRADYFVHDYSYSAPSTNSSILMLHIGYEPRDIKWILKKAGLGYWGSSRPLLLVWVATITPEKGVEIIGDDSPVAWLRNMKLQAKNLGVPLIFPLMDMSDMSQISSEDVTGFDLSALQAVGKRYAPNGYLLGVITQTGTDYQSHWKLIVGNDSWESNITEKDINGVTAAILDQVGMTLAKHYDGVINPDNPIWLKMQVSRVTDQNELNTMVQMLKQINVVKQVQLAQVTADVVKLSVLVTTTMTTFAEKLGREKHFSLQSKDDKENLLIYEWLR